MAPLFARAFLTVLLGAILSGTLVRFAPGFDTDVRQLDVRLSEGAIEALKAERQREGELGTYYVRFLSGYVTGDLGESSLLNQPVKRLIAERFAPTLTAVSGGLVMAWIAAAALAVLAHFFGAPARGLLTAASGVFLSIPVAVLAFLFLLHGNGSVQAAALVVGCAVFPKLAQYLHQLFARARSAPHVMTAHARGLSPAVVFLRHVMAPCLPEIAALAGVSLAFAMSAAIPAEVVLDIPGLGQLAWQAALGRDLNLLVQLTMLITAVVVFANALAEWPSLRRRVAQ